MDEVHFGATVESREVFAGEGVEVFVVTGGAACYASCMTQKQIIAHWRKGAQDSIEVARMCLEAQKFEHALFSAHLAVEKALKARFIEKHDDAAPFTHELHELLLQIPLNLPDEQMTLLREMSRLAVRARYADHQWSEEQATAKNAEYWIVRAEELLQSIFAS